MKRFQLVIALLCFLFAGQVFAQQSQSAIRIFQQTTADEASWQRYLSMQDKADVEAGFLPIHKLAEQAFSTSLNRNYLESVPESLRSPEVYQAIFILMNGFANQEKISFVDLRQRSVTSGLYLPNMRMFVNESGAGFEDFKAGIAKSIKTDEKGVETIPSSILGVLSFLKNKDTSYMLLVSENFRTQSNNIVAFTSYNELPATITLDEFKKLGQTEGLWVPVEVEHLKAFAKAFKDRTAALVRQETLLKNTTETNTVVQALQEEIARLKKLGGSDNGQVKQINNLQNQLNKLVEQVKSLSDSQGDLAKNQVDSITVLNQAIVGVKEKILQLNSIEERLASENAVRFEDMAEVVAYNQKVIVIGLLGAIIFFFALGFFVRRNDKKDFKQKLATTNEAVESIRDEVNLVSFDRELVAKSKIASLGIGKAIALPVTVLSDVFEITVTRVNESRISVTGIRHHKSDTKDTHEYGLGTNVQAMIVRAAGLGNLTNLSEIKTVA